MYYKFSIIIHYLGIKTPKRHSYSRLNKSNVCLVRTKFNVFFSHQLPFEKEVYYIQHSMLYLVPLYLFRKGGRCWLLVITLSACSPFTVTPTMKSLSHGNCAQCRLLSSGGFPFIIIWVAVGIPASSLSVQPWWLLLLTSDTQVSVYSKQTAPALAFDKVKAISVSQILQI